MTEADFEHSIQEIILNNAREEKYWTYHFYTEFKNVDINTDLMFLEEFFLALEMRRFLREKLGAFIEDENYK